MRDRCNINTDVGTAATAYHGRGCCAERTIAQAGRLNLALALDLALDHYTNSYRNCFGLYSKHLCRFGDCLRALVMARRSREEFYSNDDRCREAAVGKGAAWGTGYGIDATKMPRVMAREGCGARGSGPVLAWFWIE